MGARILIVSICFYHAVSLYRLVETDLSKETGFVKIPVTLPFFLHEKNISTVWLELSFLEGMLAMEMSFGTYSFFRMKGFKNNLASLRCLAIQNHRKSLSFHRTVIKVNMITNYLAHKYKDRQYKY